MLEVAEVIYASPLPNYGALIGILIIIGLYLHNWHPPIKPQYIATFMLIGGLGLGYFLVGKAWLGFIFAGIVFYKDEFARDARMVAKSYEGFTKAFKKKK